MSRRGLIIVITVLSAFLAGFFGGRSSSLPAARAQGGPAVAGRTGDINGDGRVNVTDPIALLSWLFFGGPEPAPVECPPPPPAGQLPATGQTTCTDAAGSPADCAAVDCPSQDGFHRAGCPGEGRFEDRQDGTVLDRCTGLLWQKETADGRRTWCEALQYCEGLSHAGSGDWRLPNARELQSLVDHGRSGLLIDPAFPTETAGYWTSTSQVDFPESAWCVVFSTGTTEWIGKETPLYVRAVRSER